MSLYHDNYAIQLLQKEIEVLESILKSGDFDGYTEAKKERDKRLKQLKNAVSKLENNS